MSEGDIKKYNFKELLAVAYIGVAVSIFLLGVRQVGGLQQLELMAFDRLMQLRPDPGPDPRLLVVEVTEEDLDRWQEWPLSDRTLARVLAKLQRHQPAAIGLDLARNFGQGEGKEELVAQMSLPNFIAITSVGNRKSDRIPPPPEVPQQQVGSIDVPIDPDGAMRRHLLFNYDGEAEVNWHSLALRLARTYIKGGCPGYRPTTGVPCSEISAKLTPEQEYQLGDVVFHKLQTNSGGYQSIPAGGYQILTNYRSANNVARTISLTNLLEEDFDPEWVKDKIVLVGVSAPSLQDLFFTPLSAIAVAPRMPGVVIQTQMTSQILSAVLDGDRLFWYWPEWAEIVWIVAWAIAACTLVAVSRKPLILIVGIGLLLTVLWGSTFILFLHQGWIPVATPTIAIILAIAGIVFYKENQAERQQQMVMRLLGQQTSPEIADALWESRDRLLESGRLPWQKVTATLFFSDIKGFSTISEEMQDGPEKLMGWLNEYLNALSDEVLAHRGIVNKFLGDGMMAVFGVPIASTTEAEIAADAHKAVNCALAIREKLVKLNRDWKGRQLPAVQMRVGIFTGVAMVGSLGGKNRLEYAVIGDSANTASRLESSFKDRQVDDCRILIGKETLQYLDGKFEVEDWGSLRVKGKKQCVEVYRVIGKAINN